jgi:cyclopropane-fatty-acyl-phospholipid synthase
MSEGRAIDRFARTAAKRVLDTTKRGYVEATEGGRRMSFGDPTAGLRASLEIKDPRAWTGMLCGSTGFGEGYVDGYWESDDLVSLVRIAARNTPAMDALKRRFAFALVPGQRLGGMVPRNTRLGARQNISAHYDLGNELFESFLDEHMQYSSGYFPSPEATLEQAQVAKLDRICDGLRLAPDDHLVEIGTGWGGLAIHAAANYGCRVTTTTISKEQRQYAIERIAEAGLSDRIEVLFSDYRDLQGTYDKLVSIEMIEAVGWQYFKVFFRKCSELLRPDGLMSLQAIVMDDRAYEVEKASKSFANTHVFPGGCLPSQKLIGDLIASQTDMRTIHADDITPHYSETLRIWRERFNDSWERLEPLGYDQRFRRLWNFYLAFCEAGFRERRIRDLQILFAKPRYLEDDIHGPDRAGRSTEAGDAEAGALPHLTR